MKRKRLLKRLLFVVLICAVAYGVRYCWVSFPIASTYGAKVLCSAVFISGRAEGDVITHDLDFFPLNIADCSLNRNDSSATCSIFGLATRKAIYREGLGTTLINEFSEKAVRSQRFNVIHPRAAGRDSIRWPSGDRLPATYPLGVDSMAVQVAVRQAFREKDSSHLVRTRALIVLHDGEIIAEQYAPGFSRHTRLAGWSMTKSITAALIGVLVGQGQIRLASPPPVPEWSKPDDDRRHITVTHLLQQTSGLMFEEKYGESSHATRMLFQKGDMAAFAASLPARVAAGSEFHYSSGNTNILSRIIRHTVGDESYHRFPYEALFHRVGMYNTVLEPDASGTFVGSSFCFATARDWARFGLLYANEGMHGTERILPAGWVDQSVTPASAAEQGCYGFQWWLNAGRADDPADRLYPELPRDMYFADGYEGQNIFVIPSKRLVVVRLGLTRASTWGESDLLQALMRAIPDTPVRKVSQEAVRPQVSNDQRAME